MPECQNCGAFVTDGYVRVFEPVGVDRPECCPWCPDMVRDERGRARERHTKSARTC